LPPIAKAGQLSFHMYLLQELVAKLVLTAQVHVDIASTWLGA
jgi:hypothetical protein